MPVGLVELSLAFPMKREAFFYDVTGEYFTNGWLKTKKGAV